jgi:hypothetical protein
MGYLFSYSGNPQPAITYNINFADVEKSLVELSKIGPDNISEPPKKEKD